MAKLINTFSWSHSAASDFVMCRRKRYWSKYGAWGGWERDATVECKTAYRLNKMTNRFCMYGIASEDAVMWMYRQHQQGKQVSVEEAFDTIAKPQLRKSWDESKNGVWRRVAKAGCLHEHYYPQFCGLSDREIMQQIADVVKLCLKNFQEKVLPVLADVTPDMEIPIGVVGKGDPEHFFFEGIKIYAIPDYVYVKDGVWHIIDWKSGGVKKEHVDQVALYALWAQEKHGISPDNVRLRLDYLQHGEHHSFQVSEEDLEGVKMRIHESVQDMTQYLVNEDISANQPYAKLEWDMCYEPQICQGCSFYELCHRELKEALGDEIEKFPPV
ncbi:PD-(D/E)XK nuclease family protein [Kiritimatiellota bacterium B12222]|nr:PD-(D/E)XK nuclease family protein [Kiritimatiellota bacterium B12222]